MTGERNSYGRYVLRVNVVAEDGEEASACANGFFRFLGEMFGKGLGEGFAILGDY